MKIQHYIRYKKRTEFAEEIMYQKDNMWFRGQTCKQFRRVVGCALDAAAVPSAMSERLLAHRRRVFGGLHQSGHHIRRSPACPGLLPLQQTRALRAGARFSGPRVHVAGATEAAKHNVLHLNATCTPFST